MFLFLRKVYLTVMPMAFNSRVGNCWTQHVLLRLLLLQNSPPCTLSLDIAAVSKDSLYNEQPNQQLNNGPLLAE